MARKGWLRRGLISWIARAATSLPLPVSPVIRMVARVGAACCSSAKMACMAGDWATMPPSTPRLDSSRSSRSPRSARRRCSIARSRIARSSFGRTGFSRYQNAPISRTVSTAFSTLPNAVSTMAGGAAPVRCNCSSNSIPLITGMFRSVMIASAPNAASFSSASRPFSAVSVA